MAAKSGNSGRPTTAAPFQLPRHNRTPANPGPNRTDPRTNFPPRQGGR